MPPTQQVVDVAGRRLKVTNLDKVMYPATGTTKADVMAYYQAVAHLLIPQIAWRPATRKRWVDGVGTADKPGQVFFRKDLEAGAPDWVPRMAIRHKERANTYPMANEPAVLAWFAQVAALEIHTPQWRFRPDGAIANPDRLVLDLDPGPGAGLAECVVVAKACREILDDMGMTAYPVTSGSKGIHLYAAVDGTHTSDQISGVAKELARSLQADLPDLVVADMKRSLREGKVLVDWSQNSANKTTVAPYSLRGRERPMVAAPRTWAELDDPKLAHLDYEQVLERLADDPIAPLGWHGSLAGETGPASTTMDRLATYRSMRDAAATPEPVPAEPPVERELAPGELPSFVIQKHQARRLHWDFRLEHSGVLVSWAVPKGPPMDGKTNRLAVQTEDHPLDYGTFAGDIPKGQYGAGHVDIWDSGTYELEKWREGEEVIATLYGKPDGGLGGQPRRYALIRTKGMGDGNNWLLHLMAPAGERAKGGGPPEPVTERVRATKNAKPAMPAKRAAGTPDVPDVPPPVAELPTYEPMLATAGKESDLRGTDWAYEMKWDGVRAVITVNGPQVTIRSRTGRDVTSSYPELAELAGLVAEPCVLDGEIVALDDRSRPSFGLLQPRMAASKPADVTRARAAVDVHFLAFDILNVAGRSLLREPYESRRETLAQVLREGAFVQIPGAFTGDAADAIAASKELGLEGVVAKKLDGTYLPGRRARGWVKVKFSHHQEVVVVGWRESERARTGGIASVLVAVPDDDGALRYAGRVGSGFGEADLAEAARRFATIASDEPAVEVPAEDRKDAHWVAPDLVAEVAYTEVTGGGRLRHPVWRGWRDDKQPGDVKWEA